VVSDWSDPAVWVTMKFDPSLQVNLNGLIDVMRGRALVPTPDRWEDIKEEVADCLEQFVELRRRVSNDGK
jgi:hypothetical protein